MWHRISCSYSHNGVSAPAVSGNGGGKGRMCRFRDKWDSASAFKVMPVEGTGSRCLRPGWCEMIPWGRDDFLGSGNMDVTQRGSGRPFQVNGGVGVCVCVCVCVGVWVCGVCMFGVGEGYK